MQSSAYSSRGALKLKGLIDEKVIDFNNKTVVDIGSSHGGFVQMAVVSGAKLVYAVDVGYGLLDWKLRNLENIVLMEKTNARYLKKEMFNPQPQICLIDLSFISLRKILPVAFEISLESIFALVKPQFEADYKVVSKSKGVIKDSNMQKKIINDIIADSNNENWKYIDTYKSPIKGKKGNQEYFIHYERIRA